MTTRSAWRTASHAAAVAGAGGARKTCAMAGLPGPRTASSPSTRRPSARMAHSCVSWCDTGRTVTWLSASCATCRTAAPKSPPTCASAAISRLPKAIPSSCGTTRPSKRCCRSAAIVASPANAAMVARRSPGAGICPIARARPVERPVSVTAITAVRAAANPATARNTCVAPPPPPIATTRSAAGLVISIIPPTPARRSGACRQRAGRGRRGSSRTRRAGSPRAAR